MYDLTYAETAAKDLTEIFDFIAADSRDIAVRYLGEIEQSILRLKDFPQLGQQAKYRELAVQGIRVLVHDDYLVFYIIDEENKKIEIVRVLRGSRNYVHLIA